MSKQEALRALDDLISSYIYSNLPDARYYDPHSETLKLNDLVCEGVKHVFHLGDIVRKELEGK